MANGFTMRVYKKDEKGVISHAKDMPDIDSKIFWYAKELAIGTVTHNMVYLSELTCSDAKEEYSIVGVKIKAPIEYWYEIIHSYPAYVKQLKEANFTSKGIHIIKKNNGIYATEEQAKAVLERLNQPKRSPF